MSEFPRHPTRRELRKQREVADAIQAINEVWKRDAEAVMYFGLDGVEVVEQLPSSEPGFNWDTFTGEVRGGRE